PLLLFSSSSRYHPPLHSFPTRRSSDLDGAKQLKDGTEQAKSGVGDLKDGSSQLVDGSKELDSGAGELVDGSGELADGLEEGLKQIPTYDKNDRDHRSDVVAVPVDADKVEDNAVDAYGEGLAAFFV